MNSYKMIQEQFKKQNIKIASVDFMEAQGIVFTTNKGKIWSANFPRIGELSQNEIFMLLKAFKLEDKTIQKAQNTKKITTNTINNFIAEVIKLQQSQNSTYNNIINLVNKIDNQEVKKLLLKELSKQTQANQMQETLKISYVDNLTGCFNSTYYHHYLSDKNTQWNRTEDIQKYNIFLNMLNDQETNAVMFIDLNNFKLINDTLGHDAGDEVLKSFGEWLQQTNIPSIRRGGDEFILLSNKDKLNQIAQELQSDEFISFLNKNIKPENVQYANKIQTTTSFGIEDLEIPKKTHSVVDVLVTKQTISKAIALSEKKMYSCKKEFKENNQNKNEYKDEITTIKDILDEPKQPTLQ